MNSLDSVIHRIRQARLSQLQDVLFVENLICFAGLHPDRRSIYGDFQVFVNEKYGLYQIPCQLAAVLTDLSREGIKDIIDIGTNQGWTTAFVVAYLQRFVPTVECLSLDPKNNLDPAVRRLNLPIEFTNKTSLEILGQKSDLCMIDGSHTLLWVNRDYYNLGIHSRFCWFHDVIDKYCHDVRRFYWDLVSTKSHKEYIITRPSGMRTMGIGIINQSGGI